MSVGSTRRILARSVLCLVGFDLRMQGNYVADFALEYTL